MTGKNAKETTTITVDLEVRKAIEKDKIITEESVNNVLRRKYGLGKVK